MTTDSMIDSRPTTPGAPPVTAPVAPTADRPRRALLWVLLVVGVFVNVASHTVLANVYVGSASGLLVLGCVAVLAARARFARTA